MGRETILSELGQPEAIATITRRARSDPDFERRLIADPAAVLAEHGVETDEGIRQMLEDTPELCHLVPTRPPGEGALDPAGEGELADEVLRGITAGGTVIDPDAETSGPSVM